jgi:hypothetical protein
VGCDASGLTSPVGSESGEYVAQEDAMVYGLFRGMDQIDVWGTSNHGGRMKARHISLFPYFSPRTRLGTT